MGTVVSLIRFLSSMANMQDGPSTTTSANNPTQHCDQCGKNLESFILFPGLPLEIRLKIWRLGFPRGRSVSFADDPLIKTISCLSGTGLMDFDDRSPLPITLSINRESREETRKHYAIIFRSDYSGAAGETKEKDKPFCFNPKLDIAWVTPISFQLPYSDKWFAYLQSNVPEVFSNTKVLEVRNWHWSSASVLVFRRRDDNSTSTSAQIHYGGSSPDTDLFKLFLRFRGLAELKLIASQHARNIRHSGIGMYSNIGDNKGDDKAKQIQLWFKENKDGFTGDVPVVSFLRN